MAQLQAIAPYPTHAIVRPPIGDTASIKQLLDIGAQTLLIPMVETPEQAKTIVAATNYPPLGARGVGSQTRATKWGQTKDYFLRARDEICLILQIETIQGLANVEAIARVDGVDAIFIGPMDIAAALGCIGSVESLESLAGK